MTPLTCDSDALSEVALIRVSLRTLHETGHTPCGVYTG